jgi:RNA polymerase sigma factor (sigma-70 family)
MNDLAPYLANHDFRALFIEKLGWDRIAHALTAVADGHTFRLDVIAHKRGFQAVLCIADRYTLFNRRRLRSIQKQLLKTAHEHIVIYACEQPRKQVWQWALRLNDGHRLRHREHPFFSVAPPTSLLTRLGGLRFTLAEEEHVTLVDALDRVRVALDTRAELDLFVNKPWYAEQSDRLATAMRAGGLPEFHAFVLFHRRLAKWGAGRLHRWFGLDEEDAEQMGMIGVLRAARGFRPELGYQFSTYATRAIHQLCHRAGPIEALLIRVPAADYWHYSRMRRTAERLDARSGPRAGDRFLDWWACRNPEFCRRWPRFRSATSIVSLSDRGAPYRREAHQLAAPNGDPRADLSQSAASELVCSALDSLEPDDARIIRLRYGFDGEPQTLETIGQLYGVTKERIRQRQQRAERALRGIVRQSLGEPHEPPKEDTEPESPPSDAASDAEQSAGGEPLPHAPAHANDLQPATRLEPDNSATFTLRPVTRAVQGDLFAHAR